jgi:hypothetical protein
MHIGQMFNQNRNYYTSDSEPDFYIEQKIKGTNLVLNEYRSETPIQCNSDSEITLY